MLIGEIAMEQIAPIKLITMTTAMHFLLIGNQIIMTMLLMIIILGMLLNLKNQLMTGDQKMKAVVVVVIVAGMEVKLKLHHGKYKKNLHMKLAELIIKIMKISARMRLLLNLLKLKKSLKHWKNIYLKKHKRFLIFHFLR